ncbi:MAG: hypothetical protein ACOVQ4_21055, partial [Flectobacillus sp.]|uniref:hypothetical protein n=1 Tax=Flectobacillus sp. TaxID=50419 RepID=UPI003B9C2B3A
CLNESKFAYLRIQQKHSNYELSRIFRIGIIHQVFIKKAVENRFFDRFFDTIQDFTRLKIRLLRGFDCFSTTSLEL